MKFVKRGKTLNTAFDEMFEELVNEDDAQQVKPTKRELSDAEKKRFGVIADLDKNTVTYQNQTDKKSPLETGADPNSSVSLDEDAFEDQSEEATRAGVTNPAEVVKIIQNYFA